MFRFSQANYVGYYEYTTPGDTRTLIKTLPDTPGHSRILPDTPGHSRTLPDTPRHSRTLPDTPGHSVGHTRTLSDRDYRVVKEIIECERQSKQIETVISEKIEIEGHVVRPQPIRHTTDTVRAKP
jgi:hypothetical protein